MNVLILGGSNSVAPTGYVRRLAEVLSRYGDAQVTNVSVGGMTTFSGVARLFELGPQAASFDLVLYEFALNDNIAFRSRDGGEALARTAIGTFIKALNAVAPQAAILPVILAKHADFPAARRSPIYSAQVTYWAELGVPVCDVRSGLSHIFAGICPDWLYRDELHLSAGAASDIAGSIIARAALSLHKANSTRTAAQVHAAISGDAALQFALRYVGPDELAAQCSGDFEMVTRSNSLMAVRALRLNSGALTLQGSPLSLSILSDRRHNWVRVREGDAQPYRVSTRFNAVDDPAINPANMDRFFYSGVPIPLVLRRSIGEARSTRLTLDFPEPGDRGELLHSAAFFVHEPQPLASRYLDLAGIVFADPH